MTNSQTKLKSTRVGFGEGLVLVGENDQRVVALTADLKESVCMSAFAEKFPKRFIEVGVAEQNLAGVASGMAAMGKIPFVGSFAIFSPGRNWEQIRTTICYNNQPVKIVGSHAGLSASADGGSHQILEDIALTRVLPNLIVLSPCDAIEAKKMVVAAAEIDKPVYIRLSRAETPIITSEETPFEIGKAEILQKKRLNLKSEERFNLEKPKIGIIATGTMVHKALAAAKELSESGINVSVMNLSTVKPLDERAIIKLAKETGAIVTVEEHQIAGGMGSAVAELLAQNHPTSMEFIGVKNQFGQTGTYEELLNFYGLNVLQIKQAVRRIMKKKG
ncbi:MAG: transketolase [Candidatus Taylorbacteria bacterium RIFCSPHIGHO2_02_FULL_44_36]|uniref:Transketolase n=1 Tax=Candidatus Taylorbacteria bacterium RIFCSPLOWO2_12_FULL_44_15c TaxID=1802333 RepID=A0A1G2P621_9BACT|nr:MAG: transketolase [Candidatus Taylorbacteria bacterium RIFCSPHIGHO2_02_FULL_44_36]OHA37920.1 MAG: transketolase [Candidatus Taylorbacteria bacterium RIFCSPLOWO2_02_FULL_44_35]OHA43760.1 MAG: transketolase [Candidatus Taylorbacteria bacterium RIFCSPLOWO2_12_FULL_44_15c]